MAKKKIILTIDGGGIRGLIPGQILTHIENLLKELNNNENYRIANHFDMIAGTSTGGILACAYLMPENGRPKYDAGEVVKIYLNRGDEIFTIPLFYRIKSAGGFLDEKYPVDGLETALNDYFGETRLSELLKPCLITAYDIERRKAHFFTQHDAQKSGYDYLLKDVTRATSASPTYFEVSYIKSDADIYYPLIDGGIFANNPALCAYAEMRYKFSTKKKKIMAKNMLILSLGTGRTDESYSYNEAKEWGLAAWTKPTMEMMMSGVSDTVDFQLQQIFESVDVPDQYLRIDGDLPPEVDPNMDCVEPANLEALKNFGDALYEKYEREITDFLKK